MPGSKAMTTATFALTPDRPSVAQSRRLGKEGEGWQSGKKWSTVRFFSKEGKERRKEEQPGNTTDK